MAATPTDPDRLVLYGSLRHGQPDFHRLALDKALDWLGPCEVRGRLYDLGPYPGFSPEGRSLVFGDLFAIRDSAALDRLDAFEGYVADDPLGSLYLRRRIALHRPSGEAWIYVYNGVLAAAPAVGSGDWLDYLRTRRR
jgi:gamma-glutamylcyclotransferase (GGCT)/AIG2-like uncharacterized protein YtfP